jgi:hypothetical protein
VPTGDTSNPGTIIGAGAASISAIAPGNAVQSLLSILFTANSPGVVSFSPSFDSIVNHDVLLYMDDNKILEGEITFSGSRLAIVPEPGALALAGSACGIFGLVGAIRRRSMRRAVQR